jgi:multidrug efflux pump subunit AcrB
MLERMKTIPSIVDVSSDRQAGGLQLDVKIDRDAAARLGVRIADIDSALNNSFSQRQISSIYTQRNQYRVILEVDPRLQRDPSDIKNIYVPSANGGPQVPLTAVIRVSEGTTPLVVNHQGPFPAVTLSFNLAPGGTLDGALLALYVGGIELSMTALIGVILLIGIVKKNGFMLVDFALDGERQRGLQPAVAIYEACLARFRPILMTTLAALLGAIPLAIAVGPGSEIRRPLGITIIGGLIVSQMLTLYTTPVIYLLLDRLHRRLGGAPRPVETIPAPAPN